MKIVYQKSSFKKWFFS